MMDGRVGSIGSRYAEYLAAALILKTKGSYNGGEICQISLL